MPIVAKVSEDYKIPVLYFSFDSQTSETGIKTRIEAFYDMLSMKKAAGGAYSCAPCTPSRPRSAVGT